MLFSTYNQKLNADVIVGLAVDVLIADQHVAKLLDRGAKDLLEPHEKVEVFSCVLAALKHVLKRDSNRTAAYITSLLSDEVVLAAVHKIYAQLTLVRNNNLLQKLVVDSLQRAEDSEHKRIVSEFYNLLSEDERMQCNMFAPACYYAATQCGSVESLKKFVWYIERALKLGSFLSTDGSAFKAKLARDLKSVAYAGQDPVGTFEKYGIDATEFTFEFTPNDPTKASWSVNDFFIGEKIVFEVQRTSTDVKIVTDAGKFGFIALLSNFVI